MTDDEMRAALKSDPEAQALYGSFAGSGKFLYTDLEYRRGMRELIKQVRRDQILELAEREKENE